MSTLNFTSVRFRQIYGRPDNQNPLSAVGGLTFNALCFSKMRRSAPIDKAAEYPTLEPSSEPPDEFMECRHSSGNTMCEALVYRRSALLIARFSGG
jgi:hypothetical protein